LVAFLLFDLLNNNSNTNVELNVAVHAIDAKPKISLKLTLAKKNIILFKSN